MYMCNILLLLLLILREGKKKKKKPYYYCCRRIVVGHRTSFPRDSGYTVVRDCIPETTRNRRLAPPPPTRRHEGRGRRGRDTTLDCLSAVITGNVFVSIFYLFILRFFILFSVAVLSSLRRAAAAAATPPPFLHAIINQTAGARPSGQLGTDHYDLGGYATAHFLRSPPPRAFKTLRYIILLQLITPVSFNYYFIQYTG